MASTVVSTPLISYSVPNPVIDPSVIAPALANAALLVASPSLGCIRTYIRILKDLHQANGLPVPDLELAHGNVDYQFYCEYHTHSDATPIVSNSQGSITPNTIVVAEYKQTEVDLPEVLHDTTNKSELSISTTHSDIVNSPVCDSPNFKNDDFLNIHSTTSTPIGLTGSPDRLYSPKKSSQLESSTPTRIRATRLQKELQKVINIPEGKGSTNITRIQTHAEKKNQQPTTQNAIICHLCSHGFRDKCDIRRHLVTGACTRTALLLRAIAEGWECVTCTKSFNDRDQAERHARCHLARQGISFPVCQGDFTKQGVRFLVKHVMNRHPEYFE
ncbi:unnamed protein product [Meganyctiphanes norvegica]|uniref:C2H2-type domain-containing protein n=1 Tax=Meganyctiphanes norvegica TaxID=48144 RepID=A0AAV2S6M8_MEGNR